MPQLFDRIKIGCGTSEVVALSYFKQLLDGVGYCHEKVGRIYSTHLPSSRFLLCSHLTPTGTCQGVCHRDLKPENLLLSDSSENAVLKIADFGLSAAFAIAAEGDDEEKLNNDHNELAVLGVEGGGHSSNIGGPQSHTALTPNRAPGVSVDIYQTVGQTHHTVAPLVVNRVHRALTNRPFAAFIYCSLDSTKPRLAANVASLTNGHAPAALCRRLTALRRSRGSQD